MVEVKKKVAIFDIDGTIFRSSLLIEITKAFIEKGIFPKKAAQVYAKTYQQWFDRKDSYEKYIAKVVEAYLEYIKGVNHADFMKIAKEVVDLNKNRIYRYTRDLVRELKEKNYFILAISHSPKEVIDHFCQHLGFDKVYGWVYEVADDGKFTGNSLYDDVIKDKSNILRRFIEKEHLSLEDSVGVGDSESDIKFLTFVANPICFNPNQKLYEHARAKNWKIVVERKDVIYEITNHKSQITNNF